MSDVTRILSQINSGDPQAAEQLLPLVYDELRKLAAAKLAHEKPGQTLQATALVHEAYVRLVGVRKDGAMERERDGATGEGSDPSITPSHHPSVPAFSSRGHFFGAAAEAMRRILVESARRKLRLKHGGGRERTELDGLQIASPQRADDLVALDAALNRLAVEDQQSAELVKLRYFAGLTIPQAAEVIGVSPRQADFLWSFARAWLRRELEGPDGS